LAELGAVGRRLQALNHHRGTWQSGNTPRGFRGAVLLTAGTYEVAGRLRIGARGVVLRGQGDDL
ncbi:MAG TPA: hypothetical protein VD758_11850, partial [Gemmatimonadaceae bacterium]|nr:hypothetical protein [Gemmatimonadaceae bacterium]